MELAKTKRIRWTLLLYDLLAFIVIAALILVVYPLLTGKEVTALSAVSIAACALCLIVSRIIFKVYEQILRYATAGYYIRFIVADTVAALAASLLSFLPLNLSPLKIVSLFSVNLLVCVFLRLLYQKIYQERNNNSPIEKFALSITRILNSSIVHDSISNKKVRIAIIGAGEVGTMLASELLKNPSSKYTPVCFVDSDEVKIGRNIGGVPVISADGNLQKKFEDLHVEETILAIYNITKERRLELYNKYKDLGYRVKTYDYPLLSDGEADTLRIHEFDIEKLLFREKKSFIDSAVKSFYADKNVVITGGGGSIGSELARQIASCGPSRLTILDVYENGAYDVQQELRSIYGDKFDLRVEVVSVCDKEQIDKIFREHTPDIVIHAAAHKHVPLMERNVWEAVHNNVFGTLNVVEACEKYGVKRFIMVSTDKAVNPTNVMGATKRMCEMIVQSRSGSVTSFSATRFGNVLGSNGSVVPLFKRQIANGGPITLTDRRITRYFMMIPEAAQLVLTSGAMAKNGELYVLDMGEPVKILDLAESMVRLSGLTPYKDIDIVEIGLRPGEKLYEELLIKTEELDKTDNELIFVERDKPLDREVIEQKLEILKEAMLSKSNRVIKKALKQVVPTYHDPEEVNENV